ncbi:MAG: CdaR family protein [Sphaerochaetaceae bacterium]|nr:CdaR family protein [Sphaerochaetaceae bacterium]
MKRSKFVQSMFYNWPVKVLSIVFAIAVYLFIHYTTLGERRITIPMEVALPSGYVAASLVPDSVEISIKGDDDLIYLIDPTYITASLDFSYVSEPGIAKAPVMLSYMETLYKADGVSIAANPSQFRVLFESPGDQGGGR